MRRSRRRASRAARPRHHRSCGDDRAPTDADPGGDRHVVPEPRPVPDRDRAADRVQPASGAERRSRADRDVPFAFQPQRGPRPTAAPKSSPEGCLLVTGSGNYELAALGPEGTSG
jgi:hypothetical protein